MTLLRVFPFVGPEARLEWGEEWKRREETERTNVKKVLLFLFCSQSSYFRMSVLAQFFFLKERFLVKSTYLSEEKQTWNESLVLMAFGGSLPVPVVSDNMVFLTPVMRHK